VSVEKVVATIENPNSHHGILRPDKKNSEVFFEADLEVYRPMPRITSKNPPIIR